MADNRRWLSALVAHEDGCDVLPAIWKLASESDILVRR